jgi:arginase
VTRVQIIHVPYDSGYKDYRMGQGPEIILRHLKRERPFDVIEVDVQEPIPLEIGTSFAVARQIAGSIRDAVSNGAFPLVLAGNCFSCVGTIAGLGAPPPAIIWLDAHGDFNTPETTDSGFLDGMGLATAVGRCLGRLAATVSGFHQVPEKQVVLVGARAFDPMERTLLDTSGVHLIDSQRIRDRGVEAELEPALAKTRILTERAYLHIDLDVLDLADARVNEFSVAGGLRPTELLAIVGLVRKHFVLAAAAITAYDPAYDQDGRGVRAAEAIFRELTRN